jgi:hypothetical protein
VAEAKHHRWRRIVLLILLGIVIEAGLFGVARMAPAMAGLIRPMYAAVAGVLSYGIWNAARRRRGQDRRQADRREADPES